MMALSPQRYRRSPVRSRARSRSPSRSRSRSRSRSPSRSESPIVRRKSSPRAGSPSPRSKRLRKAKEAMAARVTSSSPRRATSSSPRRPRRQRTASMSPSPSPPPQLQRSSSQRQAHRHHHHHHHYQQHQYRGKGGDSPMHNGAEGRATHHGTQEEEGHFRGRRGGGSPAPSRRGFSPSLKRGADKDLDLGHRKGREKDQEPRPAVPTSATGASSAGAASSAYGAASRAEAREFGGAQQKLGWGNAPGVSAPEGDRPFRSGSTREMSGVELDQPGDSIARMEAAASALETAAKEKVKPSFELSGKLAAETNKFRGVTLLFTEPPEARKPVIRWRLYVFKEGEALKDPLYIHRQSCYLFGRERRVADIPTDHPSCSKQHAVIQYRLIEKVEADGTASTKVRPYMMDLGSTNGTYLNGERIEAQRYYELFEKDTIKFGNSSREYVLLHENSVG